MPKRRQLISQITGFYSYPQPLIRPPQSLISPRSLLQPNNVPPFEPGPPDVLLADEDVMCERKLTALNDALSRHGLAPARFEPFPDQDRDGSCSCACIVDDRSVATGTGYSPTEAIHNAATDAYWRLFDQSRGEPGINGFMSENSDTIYSAPISEMPSTSEEIIEDKVEEFISVPKDGSKVLETYQTTPLDTIKAVAAKKKLQETPIAWPKGAVSWWGAESSTAPQKRKLESEQSTSKSSTPSSGRKSKKAKLDKTHIPGGSGLARVSKFTIKPGAKMQYHDLEPGEVAPEFLDADPEDLDLHEKIATEPCTRTADNKMSLINELGQTKALVAQKTRRGKGSSGKNCVLEIINQKTSEPVFKVESHNFKEAADHGLEFIVNKLTNLEAPPPKRISKGITAWLIRKKFVQICRSDPWLYVSGKCLAGFVLERDGNFTPVSLGTGSTFIDKGDLGGEGEEIIDCHAEVIARRGFMRYLWSELEKSVNEETKEESIFERKEGTAKFALKPTVHFHLYISMPPCGFSQCYGKVNYYLRPEWSEKEVEHDLNRREKEVAYLAAKVGREGPGIYHGTLNLGPPRIDEKLQSLACSDKALKWNVCGYQGGLLCEFIEPIHMESFTLGCKFDPRRVTRAVCCRLTGYYEEGKNHPRILRYPDPPEGFMVINDHSRLFAINWNAFDNTVEVVNAHTGRIQNSQNAPSRLCKRSLSAMAVRMWKKTKERSSIPERYWELKPHLYCATRDLFYRRLKKWGCGDWAWNSSGKEGTKQFRLQVSKFSL